MQKTIVSERKELICEQCKQSLYQCDDCKGDYFEEEEVIYCSFTNINHYCKDCGEERLKTRS